MGLPRKGVWGGKCIERGRGERSKEAKRGWRKEGRRGKGGEEIKGTKNMGVSFLCDHGLI